MVGLRLQKALKQVLIFELFYKLFILCLINPLLNDIYQTYVSAQGISFNKDMLGSFVQVKGLAVFLVLFFSTLFFVFYELAVVINIIALCRQEKDFTVKLVLKCSVWNLKVLKESGILLSALYFILLLPLVNTGYVSSLVPQLEIPWFIFGEMQRTEIGRLGMHAIRAVYLILYFIMIFLPLHMVLRQEQFGKALKSSLSCYKKLCWKHRILIPVSVLMLAVVNRIIFLQWNRGYLENKEFDIHFFKYIIQSAAFRKDFLFWIGNTLISTIFMVIFLYFLLFLAEQTEKLKVVLHPAWSKDTVAILSILKRHVVQWIAHLTCCLKKKRYQFLCAAAAAAFILYIISEIRLTPLIHQPLTIGHRGCIYGIENTVDAVKKADGLGVDYAEVDVQLSKDGVPVVVHDGNLWRLAGKAVDVRSLTLKELQDLKIQSASAYPGETSRIPTLEEIIKTAKSSENGMGLLIELKSSASEGEELANAVVRLVEAYDFGEKAMFMSLNYSNILPIQEAHPEWWVGYCIYGSSGEIDDSIWKYNLDFLAVEENQVSNRLVSQAREHWLPVYVWTVTSTDKMQQYLEMGVTGLVGDVPDEIQEVITEYNRKNGTSQYYWQGTGYPKGKEFE